MLLLSVDVGITNFAYSLLSVNLNRGIQFEWHSLTLVEWRLINLHVSAQHATGRAKPMVCDYINAMRRELSLTVDISELTAVVIENQMRNPCKIIAHALYTHITSLVPHVLVGFCSAQLKLQCTISPFKQKKKHRGPPTSKAQRKKNAVKLVVSMFDEKIKFGVANQLYWNQQPKKDDLADSLLQIIRILQLL